MTSQQQDLIFFTDNTLLSEKHLADGKRLLHIITHKEATKPSWLINALIENCLAGTANLVNRDLLSTQKPRALLTYISFTSSRDSIVKSCRKQGLDLDAYEEFDFVDNFTNLFSEKIKTPLNPTTEVNSMFDEMKGRIEQSSNRHKVVVMESPELLLAATTLSSTALMDNILKLIRVCNTLILLVSVDPSITDVNNTNPTDPVFRVTDFYVKLHYTSSLNISILPLHTGKAKDITGSLCVSRGSQSLSSGLKVSEKEYVYHVSKEANVKLYFR